MNTYLDNSNSYVMFDNAWNGMKDIIENRCPESVVDKLYEELRKAYSAANPEIMHYDRSTNSLIMETYVGHVSMIIGTNLNDMKWSDEDLIIPIDIIMGDCFETIKVKSKLSYISMIIPIAKYNSHISYGTSRVVNELFFAIHNYIE